MSFLNTTAAFRHVTRLPSGTDRATAVRRLLQDHEFFVHCGPHSVACTRATAEEEAALAAAAQASDARGEYPLPAVVKQALGVDGGDDDDDDDKGAGDSTTTPTQAYRVTDVVHTLPAGLWDSRVESTYEMTDLPGAGVFVRIRSPLSVVMDTVWTVGTVAGETDAELELVEEITIYCSRLLMGTIKGLCEGGWQQIHAKMLERLAEDKAAGK